MGGVNSLNCVYYEEIMVGVVLNVLFVEIRKENLSLDNLLTTKKSEIDHWKSEHANLMQTCLGKETQLTVGAA